MADDVAGIDPAAPGSRWLKDAAVTVGFAFYVGAIFVWLGIGMEPTISAHFALFRHALERASEGHGAWAHLAARIVHPPMLMGSLPMVILQSVFSALNLTLGLVLLAKRRRDRVCQLLALAMIGTAATFNGPSHQVFDVLGRPLGIKLIHFMFHVVSGTAYLFAVAQFPDGRLPFTRPRSARGRLALGLAVGVAITLVTWRSAFLSHPPFFVGFFGVLIPVTGLVTLTARMNRTSSDEVRQQCRLLRMGLVPAGVFAAVWVCAWIVSLGSSSVAANAHHLDGWLENWFPAVFALVPVMLFLGVMRYRLWDIDVLLSRGLVYGLLTGAAGGAYAIGVSVAGALGSGIWTTAALMALVAVGVEPLRQRIRTAANRLVFGQSMSPSEAIAALAEGLDRLTPAEELAAVARLAALGTRAATVELWIPVDDQLVAVGAWPEEAARMTAVTPRQNTVDAWSEVIAATRVEGLRYRGELVGALAIRLHPGVALLPEEERLVADLVDHAGLLVHNARLSAELSRNLEALQARASELRIALAALVTTHDRERRALERNIHDGAQQDLVASIMMIRVLAPQLLGPPDGSRSAVQEVAELRALLGNTTDNLRRLCGGDLPEKLVSSGPAAQLELTLDPLRRAGLAVEIQDDSTQRAPLAVEAAVYFCCLEAAQNAAKHSRGSSITITVWTDPGWMGASVVDDGVGFDPTSVSASRGLAHLGQRLATLGGTIEVESRPGSGASLHCRVPFAVANPALDESLAGAGQ